MFSVPVIAILLFLLFDAGVVMTAIALRPRRVGDTPRCPECGYNLTGLITEEKRTRCPECGVATSEEKIVRGERHVSRRLLGAGVLLTALSGTPLISGLAVVLRGVDIYGYLPARVLVTGLRWGDDKIAERSIAELRGRLATNGLSAEALDALIEACLDEQERTESRKDISSKIIDWLGLPTVANAMTAEQKERMYANLCRDIRLETRRRVVCGDTFPLALESARHIPEGYHVRWQVRTLCNGDEYPPEGAKITMGTGGTLLYPVGSTPGPGPLYVHLDAFVQVAGSRTSPVLYHCELERTLPVEVLPRDAPSPIKLVRSEEIDAAVARLAWAMDIIVSKSSISTRKHDMAVYIGVDDNIPCNLAFDIYIKLENQCILIGNAYFKSADGGHTWYVGTDIDRVPDDRVDLILRSSREAAGRSLDMYEIWGGDLCIENVPVSETVSGLRPAREEQKHRARLLDPRSAPVVDETAP